MFNREIADRNYVSFGTKVCGVLRARQNGPVS
jgi:hypothetical protein